MTTKEGKTNAPSASESESEALIDSIGPTETASVPADRWPDDFETGLDKDSGAFGPPTPRRSAPRPLNRPD